MSNEIWHIVKTAKHMVKLAKEKGYKWPKS